jgi:type 1 fimbria pilin
MYLIRSQEISMNKKLIATVFATSLSLFGMTSAQAEETATDVTAPGGTVHFVGQVVNAGCSVASDSLDFTVYLDQVRATHLATAGTAAGQPKSFEIHLVDCDASIVKTAAVTFTGQTDADLPAALANTAGAGAAKHVALQLYGPDSKAVDMGVKSSSIAVLDGENTIPMSVDYIATDAAGEAGSVEATATFHMNYA